MCQSQLLAVALLTIMSVLSAQAQSSPFITCQNATGMSNVNATLFDGRWYEGIRAPAKNVSCVHINVNVVNNRTLTVTTNYSPTRNGLIMNKKDIVNVSISEIANNNSNNGFVVSNNNINTTYKILSTDYSSDLVLCGYTNATDPRTSFGIVLIRHEIFNSTRLMQLQISAAQMLTGFNDSTTANITQSKSCRPSSAATSVPALATLFAAFYALLKLSY